MFQPSDETAGYTGLIPDDTDHSNLDEPQELGFIPDDPAELRRAVTDMAAHINLAD